MKLIDPEYHLWRCSGDNREAEEILLRAEAYLRSDRDYIVEALEAANAPERMLEMAKDIHCDLTLDDVRNDIVEFLKNC